MPSNISGRVDIELIVDIPEYADLIEQPQQGCIWCQARGAASEISRVERQTVPSQKVSISAWVVLVFISVVDNAYPRLLVLNFKVLQVSATQKFYDDLDSLIFTTPGEESATEAESQPSGEELQEGRVRIGCTINTSPGTSEVHISFVLSCIVLEHKVAACISYLPPLLV